MRRILSTILILFLFTNISFAQERLAIYRHTNTFDLGGSKMRWTMTLARDFDVYITADSVVKNISGKDTVFYSVKGISNYKGSIRGGNWVDNFNIEINKGKIKKHLVEKINRKIVDNSVTGKKDTIREYHTIKKNNKIIMRLLGGSTTWSWRPDATAGKDTYTSSDAPSTNFGTIEYMAVGNNDKWEGWIEFPNLTDSIPAGVTITSAVCSLNVNQASGDVDICMKVCTESWDEATIDDDDEPAFVETYNSDTISTVIDTGKWGFDITHSVQKMEDATITNYGWAIEMLATSAVQWQCRSSDFAGVPEKPEIVVDYTTDVTARTGITKEVESGTTVKAVENGEIIKEVYP